jgi:3-oxoacyl-[acyl-carrier protein] reductase
VAKRFAAEGAKVAVLSLTPAHVDRTVSEIETAGGVAIGVVCDISNPDQITSAVERVAAAFGQIDILVNNAFDPSTVVSLEASLLATPRSRSTSRPPASRVPGGCPNSRLYSRLNCEASS